jgi:hypothetical protein
MATKTRPKTTLRNVQGKSGRRPPVKPSRGREIPLLPVAVGAILLALAIAFIIYIAVNGRSTPPVGAAAGIPCDNLEHTQVHYHAALQIMYQGNVLSIPSNVGIVTSSSGSASCYYWLHVHANDPNVIHIESPANQTFTLGQFFSVWDSWSKNQGGPAEPLDSTHVSTLTLTPDQKLVVYIDLQDGKGPQPYTGDPKSIVLKAHEVITIEITPPVVTTPPAFKFPNGE